MNRRNFIQSLIAVPLAPLVVHKPEASGLTFAKLEEIHEMMKQEMARREGNIWVGKVDGFVEWGVDSDPLRFDVES